MITDSDGIEAERPGEQANSAQGYDQPMQSAIELRSQEKLNGMISW